ncbi:MFS transporter [Dinoroseobacter sp. S76]|uniref:MFS transporter n=1 Tax=Dinoroseobacter sp. S76 TaxID=3415124 RepID=UPI003C7E3F22
MTRPAPLPAVLTLMASVGVIGANGLLLSPIASAIAADLAVTVDDVLLASASYGLATAASALALAPQADRIGADRALRWALWALALGAGLSALAPTLWMIWLAQALCGLATGVALPSSYGLAAQIAPKGAEARTMGRVLAGWTLSLVVGVTLAALIADLVGWRWVYGAMALATLCLIRALRALPSPPRRGAATSPLSALQVPGILTALLSMGALMLAFYLCYTFIGAHVTETLGRSTSAAGLVALSYGTGFGLVTLADPLLDRLGPRRAAIPLFAVTVLLYLGMAWAAADYHALLAVAFLWGLTQHLGLNLAVGRLTALDPGQRGAILGLSSAVTYLAVFGGASLGRRVFENAGFSALPLLAAALLAAMTLEALRRRA